MNQNQIGLFRIIFGLVGLICCVSTSFGQQWTSLTPLPDGYQEHCLVYANGYLYNIGGVSDSNGGLDGYHVFYSQVYSNGTIGAWNSTTSLPENVFDAAAIADSGYIYVLGGNRYTDEAGQWTTNTVYYTKINSDGSLGVWQTANPLPQSVYWFGATVWNHTIYVTGGLDGNGYDYNSVNAATIQADGSLSAWVARTPLPTAISAQSMAANGYLYVIGGAINDGNDLDATVYFSTINSDGTLAGWNQTAPMPKPLSNLSVVSGAGWVFAMGGWNGFENVNTFYGTSILGDGSLGSWGAKTTLPQYLIFLPATVAGPHVFISGGANPYNASSNVYSMPLPPRPASLFLNFAKTNQLQLASSTNTGFGFMASSDLMNWTKIGWGFTDTNGLLIFQDTNSAAFPLRFYKAYWPLP